MYQTRKSTATVVTEPIDDGRSANRQNGDTRTATIPQQSSLNPEVRTDAFGPTTIAAPVSARSVPVDTMMRAPIEAQGDDTLSSAQFLSMLGLQLLLLAAVFVTFGVIALIAFGSILAVSGLFFIGGGALVLSIWARLTTRSR